MPRLKPFWKDYNIHCLGLIAGRGDLPRDLIQACQAHHISYSILAYEGQTDPLLLKGHPHEWLKLAQVGQTLKYLRHHKISHIVMAGYFTRPTWRELKPDLKGIKLIAKLMGKPMGDDGLFRVIINFFEQEGFSVIAPEDILGQDAMISHGVLTTAQPDAQDLQDIKRGFSVAKALGAQDVGQSVVVQDGLILGVEAIEGSDSLIERTAALKQNSSSGGVFVKVIKPDQETRVDRSVIGPKTIEQVSKSGFKGIAAEAQHVILLNKDETIALANEKGLFIVGMSYDETNT